MAQLSLGLQMHLELATFSFKRQLRQKVFVTNCSTLCSYTPLAALLLLGTISLLFKQKISIRQVSVQLRASSDPLFSAPAFCLFHKKARHHQKTQFFKKFSQQLPDNSLRDFWSRPKQSTMKYFMLISFPFIFKDLIMLGSRMLRQYNFNTF